METTLTIKGQITIPKQIRDALALIPGNRLRFAVNGDGEVVLQKTAVSKRAGRANKAQQDRFDAARGKADVKWRTDELMQLLRGGA